MSKTNFLVRVRDAAIAGFLATSICVASAQVNNPGVQQSGAVVAGNCTKWGPGVGQITDAGAPCATGTITPSAMTQANDTNVTLTLSGAPATSLLQAVQLTMGWTGTLAAARLNANVVQGVTNDTNVTASISAQNLTLGWSGVLAAARLNSNVVQSFTNDTNITASIAAQNATLGWAGTLSKTRGGLGGAITNTRAGDILYFDGSGNPQILPGNNSGTQVLSENASGVPAWSAAGSGTVTSVGVSSAYGLAIGSSPVTASGTITANLSMSGLNNSLGADVALNSIGTYFTGPTTAQGSTGTWLAMGTVTLTNAASATTFACKLWDGTSVIDSIKTTLSTAAFSITASMSGFLATPAGNLRISCADLGTANGVMSFNGSGNSKDSTLTVLRIN